ncbi:hypothetical protein Asi02nite_55140 [Asanoa siamensis]|uniref:Uncharacterized protein n=1 Tax=Asanoa siamensis TaxID=926357 RepID=A0ABQ4CXJ9_9ACTN|nr:hypothetical protein Asi02nite_55140 [Asanoa siamensis]
MVFWVGSWLTDLRMLAALGLWIMDRSLGAEDRDLSVAVEPGGLIVSGVVDIRNLPGRVVLCGQDVNVVLLDVGVAGYQRQAFDLSLSYKHPIEGVAVVWR